MSELLLLVSGTSNIYLPFRGLPSASRQVLDLTTVPTAFIFWQDQVTIQIETPQ